MEILAKFEIPGDDGERVELGLAKGTISGGEDVPDWRIWFYRSDGDELIRVGYSDEEGGLSWGEAKKLLMEEIKLEVTRLVKPSDLNRVWAPGSVNVKVRNGRMEVELG